MFELYEELDLAEQNALEPATRPPERLTLTDGTAGKSSNALKLDAVLFTSPPELINVTLQASCFPAAWRAISEVICNLAPVALKSGAKKPVLEV